MFLHKKTLTATIGQSGKIFGLQKLYFTSSKITTTINQQFMKQ